MEPINFIIKTFRISDQLVKLFFNPRTPQIIIIQVQFIEMNQQVQLIKQTIYSTESYSQYLNYNSNIIYYLIAYIYIPNIDFYFQQQEIIHKNSQIINY
ncbi:unnamed protein product [Paramecium pentaurelia]|uniref:Uncharacterized protein n=1 Tax=Paramecium pentaurelia TaxID=43138 RepID=A0A8S1VJR3_9CILI|nr:unnamed protein product [Paramecium pentaurelia]